MKKNVKRPSLKDEKKYKNLNETGAIESNDERDHKFYWRYNYFTESGRKETQQYPQEE